MPLYHEVVSAAGETATKILAQRTKVRRRVVVTCDGGKTASVVWSDLKPDVTLNLPTLPPDSVMTRAEADRMVGYIAHECCHVIHTDWSAWTRACREGDAVRELTNCLEDVRIERAEIRAKAFPALRTLLSSLVTQTHADALAGAARDRAWRTSRM
jgi:3-mercaptopyruvate sulfurtransferase SseA